MVTMRFACKAYITCMIQQTSKCVSVFSSVCVCVCLCMPVSVCASICLFVLSLCLSACLSVRRSVFVCLSVYACVCMYVCGLYVSVCLFVWLSLLPLCVSVDLCSVFVHASMHVCISHNMLLNMTMCICMMTNLLVWL